MKKQCSVAGCLRPHFGRTFCTLHYLRWRKHGNPSTVKKVWSLDLISKRFGRLVVLARAPNRHHGDVCWVCLCDCGEKTTVVTGNLRSGSTRSCGCLFRELCKAGKARLSHGEIRHGRQTPEYRSWSHMKSRCLDRKGTTWAYYGGRGITVCKRWRTSFQNFLTDMGRKPSPKHSLDRIDNNGNYKPSNCRWATQSQQRRNSRGWLKHRSLS